VSGLDTRVSDREETAHALLRALKATALLDNCRRAEQLDRAESDAPVDITSLSEP